jgi:hypothetical protein
MSDNRSTFVTVVAWLFIVLSGYAVAVSLLQNAMVHLMFQPERLSEMPHDMPATASFIFNNAQLLVFALFLVFLTVLIASIGLLRRKNWARVAFIVFLSLGILWNLGVIVLQTVFFGNMPEMPRGPQAEGFDTMWTIMQWFMVIFGIGVAALFGWIIKRLISEAVRREFNADAQPVDE